MMPCCPRSFDLQMDFPSAPSLDTSPAPARPGPIVSVYGSSGDGRPRTDRVATPTGCGSPTGLRSRQACFWCACLVADLGRRRVRTAGFRSERSAPLESLGFPSLRAISAAFARSPHSSPPSDLATLAGTQRLEPQWVENVGGSRRRRLFRARRRSFQATSPRLKCRRSAKWGVVAAHMSAAGGKRL